MNSMNDWIIESNEDYLYISYKDKPGSIYIKKECEGFVVDIVDNGGFVNASTYALYNELMSENDE